MASYRIFYYYNQVADPWVVEVKSEVLEAADEHEATDKGADRIPRLIGPNFLNWVVQKL